MLRSRPEVDPHRIGLVGVCLGGGYAVRAAAENPRVKAVVGIAGGYNSPAWFAERMGIDNYRAALAGFLDSYDEFLPAVAPGGAEAAMGGDEPYAYYGTSRSASPHWVNRVTRGSLHTLMTFDALGAAPLLAATPLLVVHGRVDAYCAPELAAELHRRAAGEKEIVWLDAAQHIDLYDTEPYVTDAASAGSRLPAPAPLTAPEQVSAHRPVRGARSCCRNPWGSTRWRGTRAATRRRRPTPAR